MVMQTKHCVCSDADETAGLCGDNMLWTLSRGSGVGSGMCSADCLASVKSWTDLKLESAGRGLARCMELPADNPLREIVMPADSGAGTLDAAYLSTELVFKPAYVCGIEDMELNVQRPSLCQVAPETAAECSGAFSGVVSAACEQAAADVLACEGCQFQLSSECAVPPSAECLVHHGVPCGTCADAQSFFTDLEEHCPRACDRHMGHPTLPPCGMDAPERTPASCGGSTCSDFLSTLDNNALRHLLDSLEDCPTDVYYQISMETGGWASLVPQGSGHRMFVGAFLRGMSAQLAKECGIELTGSLQPKPQTCSYFSAMYFKLTTVVQGDQCSADQAAAAEYVASITDDVVADLLTSLPDCAYTDAFAGLAIIASSPAAWVYMKEIFLDAPIRTCGLNPADFTALTPPALNTCGGMYQWYVRYMTVCDRGNCGTTACSDFLGSIDDATLAELQSGAALCSAEGAGFVRMMQYSSFAEHAAFCGFDSVCAGHIIFFCLCVCVCVCVCVLVMYGCCVILCTHACARTHTLVGVQR